MGMGTYAYASVHDFTGGNDGKLPYSNVSFDSSFNLYGTTSTGGANQSGVVWEFVQAR